MSSQFIHILNRNLIKDAYQIISRLAHVFYLPTYPDRRHVLAKNCRQCDDAPHLVLKGNSYCSFIAFATT